MKQYKVISDLYGIMSVASLFSMVYGEKAFALVL